MGPLGYSLYYKKVSDVLGAIDAEAADCASGALRNAPSGMRHSKKTEIVVIDFSFSQFPGGNYLFRNSNPPFHRERSCALLPDIYLPVMFRI